ncbi:MAG TPA: bile acid:sodium symporter family protein [Polyangiaceae bacterium]|nr:bile acid:sodium symporter family protein [Polyangiaceae bacterium]
MNQPSAALDRMVPQRRFPKFDPFTLALFGCAVLGHLVPVRGAGARVADHVLDAGIFSVFFLNGARLSRAELWAGLRQTKLQLSVLLSTFVLFPVLGLVLRLATARLTTPELTTGLMFLCTLPSTVQSSIALTALAGGNIPAAVCAAATSNVLGVFATPLLVGLLGLGHVGAGSLTGSIWGVVMQLLLPFGLGHASRFWTGAWVARQKKLLSWVDRATILLVVYTAFSRARIEGLWQATPTTALLGTLCLVGVLLVCALTLTTLLARRLGFRLEDEVTLVFCGSKKSLASGVPIARVLFGAQAGSLGALVLPIMLYHQLQLFACAWLAQRYRRRLDQSRVAGATLDSAP